jgi:hypothetical protein
MMFLAALVIGTFAASAATVDESETITETHSSASVGTTVAPLVVVAPPVIVEAPPVVAPSRPGIGIDLPGVNIGIGR